MKVILLTEEEFPYSTAVVIDRFEEAQPVSPICHHFCRTRFPEGIVGRGGEKLKEIGGCSQGPGSVFRSKNFLELHQG